MFSLLRRRNFGLLWTGQLISLMGDWVLMAALPYHVYAITGSTLATGSMFIAYILPRLLLGSVAGVFVDRWDRRRTMIAADLLRATTVLLLLFVRSVDGVWLVYVAAMAESIVSQFFGPAKSALLPILVGEDQLVAANSLDGLGDNVSRLIGPSVGGLIMATVGLAGVALLDSASFLISGLLILFIRVPAARRERVEGNKPAARWGQVWREWVEGLGLIRGDRAISALFTVLALASLGDSILTALLVPLVSKVLGAGSAEFGLLLTARGLGGLIGGLALAQFGRAVSPARLLTAGLLSASVILWGAFHFPILWVALALVALVGIPAMGWIIGAQTMLQCSVGDRYRGRILGAYGATSAVLALVGMAAGSALGDVVGLIPMLDLSCALEAAAGLIALWKLVPLAGTRVAASAAAVGMEAE